MDLRRFPAALYLRLFGAAGFGYIVGSVGTKAASITLAIACFSFGATLAGWLLMRPLMREAKQAMASTSLINPPPEEKNDTDH
jgi:alpha/beta superfamily hydrolase